MVTKAFRLVVCFAVTMAVLRLSPSTEARQATPAAGDGTFQPAACMVALPAGFTEGVNASCGYLVVPLKHAEPDGPTINLAVVRLKSTSSRPAAEPLVMLNGGPGGAMETWLLLQFVPGGYYGYASLLDRQDVIVFDQRGAGVSQPALNCPMDSASTANSSDTGQMPATECMRQWKASGLDLSAFRTTESAADVEALRSALGYRQVDLYGVSYGTRLALTVMRDFPASIRSVVLSSPSPLEADPFSGQIIGFDRALTALFSDCAADEACFSAFPDLDARLKTAYDRLNDSPVSVEVSNRSQPLMVDGSTFLGILYNVVFATPLATSAPAFITAVAHGNTQLLQQFAMQTQYESSGISWGNFYSVICQDEAPFADYSTVNEISRSAGVRPELLSKAFFDSAWPGLLGICGDIGLPPSSNIEDQPVISDIPTLVFTGEYDPITPPSNGELLQRDLSRMTLIELPGLSHAPLEGGGACTLGIAEAFLSDPSASVPTDDPCLNFLSPAFPTVEPGF